MKNTIPSKIQEFFQSYLEMNIQGTIINCPYWANKIRGGKVTHRGFLNGKGDAKSIYRQLNSKIKENFGEKKLEKEEIRRFAKRNRIGIDCSGLCFRALQELVQKNLIKNINTPINDFYQSDINKTNANKLTAAKFTHKISNLSDIRFADLIRLKGGKHVLFVLSKSKKEIVYIHSSHLTKLQGVHIDKIVINDLKKPLNKQKWLEKTKNNENFGSKYYSPLVGDGVFRLKLFDI